MNLLASLVVFLSFAPLVLAMDTKQKKSKTTCKFISFGVLPDHSEDCSSEKNFPLPYVKRQKAKNLLDKFQDMVDACGASSHSEEETLALIFESGDSKEGVGQKRVLSNTVLKSCIKNKFNIQINKQKSEDKYGYLVKIESDYYDYNIFYILKLFEL